MKGKLDRRSLLLTGAGLAALFVLAGCDGADKTATQDGQSAELLTDMIVVLFPYRQLKRAVYADVAARVRQQLQGRKDWPVLRKEGAAALGSDWRHLGADDRVAKLAALSKTAFFVAVYQTALLEFYSHPDVWALVGYPGESESLGGYIHRGFDDIDWLPEGSQ